MVAITAVIVLELLLTGIRRVYFPKDQDLMQEIENYEGVMTVMKEHAAERGEAGKLETKNEEEAWQNTSRSESAADVSGWR